MGLLEIAKKAKLKDKAKRMEGERRISGNVLTKYEYCQLVAMRSRQIAMGSSIYVSVPENRRYRITPLEVAELEFKEKKLPMRVKRVHPNGDYEFWGLDEMDFDFWGSEINLSLNHLNWLIYQTIFVFA